MTDDGARFEVGHFQEAVSPLSGWCQRVRQSSLRSTCSSRFRRLQAAGIWLPGPHLRLCGLRLLEGAFVTETAMLWCCRSVWRLP